MMSDGLENISEYVELLDHSLADNQLLRLQRNEKLLRWGFAAVPLLTIGVGGLAVLGFVRAEVVAALVALVVAGVFIWLAVRRTSALHSMKRGETILPLQPKRRLLRLVLVARAIGFGMAWPLVTWLVFWALFWRMDGSYILNFGLPTVTVLFLGSLVLPGSDLRHWPRAWPRAWDSRIELAALAIGWFLAGYLWLPLLLAGFDFAGSGPVDGRHLYGLCMMCQGTAAALGVECANGLAPVPLLLNGRPLPAFPMSFYSRRLAGNRLARSVLLGRGAVHLCWVLLAIALWGALPAVAIALTGEVSRFGVMGALNVILAIAGLEVARVKAHAWPDGRDSVGAGSNGAG